MSKNKNTRREFIKVLSVAPVGALFLNLGCSGTTASGTDGSFPDTTGGDIGRADVGVDATADVSQTDAALDGSNVPDTLSDVSDSGASDVGADVVPEVCEPSGSDVEGPFHEPGAPQRTQLASVGEPGMPLIVTGRVLDEACRPIADATLDVWQADDNGDYHGANEDFRLRGQMRASATGEYMFTSVKPGRYPLGNSTRPAHVHFIVSQPGYLPLTTQMYFEGDPFLNPNDPCGTGCNSGDETLIVPFTTDPDGTIRATFDIILQRA